MLGVNGGGQLPDVVAFSPHFFRSSSKDPYLFPFPKANFSLQWQESKLQHIKTEK